MLPKTKHNLQYRSNLIFTLNIPSDIQQKQCTSIKIISPTSCLLQVQTFSIALCPLPSDRGSCANTVQPTYKKPSSGRNFFPHYKQVTLPTGNQILANWSAAVSSPKTSLTKIYSLFVKLPSAFKRRPKFPFPSFQPLSLYGPVPLIQILETFWLSHLQITPHNPNAVLPSSCHQLPFHSTITTIQPMVFYLTWFLICHTFLKFSQH